MTRPTKNGGFTFETWMRSVDINVMKLSGIDLVDLPDCPFEEWYADGVMPTAAAKRTIRNAKEG